MLLAFDVGNTNIVCGVYQGHQLVDHWRMSTDRLQTADGYGVQIGTLFLLNGLHFSDVEDIIISTVVPPLTPILERMAMRYFKIKPIFVGPGIKTGMNILYDNPKELGADRIVNAVAVVEEYGGPSIVIDLGTATTFCAINAKGNYLGGAVAPGIGISMEALFQRASKLPRIELKKTHSVICKKYGHCHAGRHLLRLCRSGGRHCHKDEGRIGRAQCHRHRHGRTGQVHHSPVPP